MAVRSSARRGISGLANLLHMVGTAIAAILIVHIVLTLLDANPANTLTVMVRTLAERLDLGLSDLFLPESPKLAVVLNYGTAALIWLLITAVVVRIVRRAT